MIDITQKPYDLLLSNENYLCLQQSSWPHVVE